MARSRSDESQSFNRHGASVSTTTGTNPGDLVGKRHEAASTVLLEWQSFSLGMNVLRVFVAVLLALGTLAAACGASALWFGHMQSAVSADFGGGLSLFVSTAAVFIAVSCTACRAIAWLWTVCVGEAGQRLQPANVGGLGACCTGAEEVPCAEAAVGNTTGSISSDLAHSSELQAAQLDREWEALSGAQKFFQSAITLLAAIACLVVGGAAAAIWFVHVQTAVAANAGGSAVLLMSTAAVFLTVCEAATYLARVVLTKAGVFPQSADNVSMARVSAKAKAMACTALAATNLLAIILAIADLPKPGDLVGGGGLAVNCAGFIAGAVLAVKFALDEAASNRAREARC